MAFLLFTWLRLHYKYRWGNWGKARLPKSTGRRTWYLTYSLWFCPLIKVALLGNLTEGRKSPPESPRPITNTAQWGQSTFWRKQEELSIFRGPFPTQFTQWRFSNDLLHIHEQWTSLVCVISFLQIEEMEKGERTMRWSYKSKVTVSVTPGA